MSESVDRTKDGEVRWNKAQRLAFAAAVAPTLRSQTNVDERRVNVVDPDGKVVRTISRRQVQISMLRQMAIEIDFTKKRRSLSKKEDEVIRRAVEMCSKWPGATTKSIHKALVDCGFFVTFGQVKTRRPPLTPEQRMESARQGQAALTPEQRSERTRKGQKSRTPEQRRESARKRQAALTPEQRSEIARKGQESRTSEQRSEIARKSNAARTPEQWREITRKRLSALTPEQWSEIARKRHHDAFTPEEWSEIVRKRRAAARAAK